jgi:hypothetical protein
LRLTVLDNPAPSVEDAAEIVAFGGTVAETDGIDIEGYEPGPVEVYGRKLKMEYVGMASVFTVIAVLIYGGAPWGVSVPATIGSFFLFLGLKKKNRDHVMCSVLLFGAALVARPAVLEAAWAVPVLLFGATVFSLERYIEKRPQQVYGLPLVIAVWAWLDGFWVLGVVFAASYLLEPRADRPGARTILVRTVPTAVVAGAAVAAIRLLGTNPPPGYWPTVRIPLHGAGLIAAAIAIVAALAVAAVYWSRLIPPHRINPLLFAALAPWDQRTAALFGMVAAVLLAATVFRHSIDSVRLRPFVKHAEWHFFWWVLALAVWAVVAG